MMNEKEPTFAQAFGGSRDMCCIAAVGDMATMGRFDEEFHIYGCAYLEKGDITYRISPSAADIYQFVAKGAYTNHYPTRVHSYIASCPVPTGMKTDIERRVKLHLARQLQANYSQRFFQELQRFGQLPADNQGEFIVKALREQIDGHFEELECQLLEGTMQIVYEAKHLQKESRADIQQWLKKTRKQMEDTPIIQRGLSRTFYGFCYQNKQNVIKTSVNAQVVPIWEQREKLQRKGYMTGPILCEMQWFEGAADIAEGKNAFRKTLQTLQNKDYFAYLQALKALPSVIDAEAFQDALVRLQETEQATAIEDFCGYGYRWHCL